MLRLRANLRRLCLALPILSGLLAPTSAAAVSVLNATFEETIGYCGTGSRTIHGTRDDLPEWVFSDFSDTLGQCQVSVLTSGIGPNVDIQAHGDRYNAAGQAKVTYELLVAVRPTYAATAPAAPIRVNAKIFASATASGGGSGDPSVNYTTAMSSYEIIIPDWDATSHAPSNRTYTGFACEGATCPFDTQISSSNLTETVPVFLSVGEPLFVLKKGEVSILRGKGTGYAQVVVDPVFSIAPGEHVALSDGSLALTTDVYEILYPDAITAVPEPQAYALFLAGLALFWLAAHRRHGPAPART